MLRTQRLLVMMLAVVPGIATAQSSEMPERAEIIASQAYDLAPGHSASTRVALERLGHGYAWHVLEHTGPAALPATRGQVPETDIRKLVEAMEKPVPSHPDPNEYGTPAQMQAAIDAAFDPAKWTQPDAHAAASAYRERLRDPAAVGRAISQVRGDFANHLHRWLKVDLHFADGTTRTATSREMGLRMVPWEHPDGGMSHSLAFSDAVAALLPHGALLRDGLVQPISEDARAAMMGYALRDANAYYAAFNRAPAAALRLRRHFTVLSMSFTDRPEPGDFAAFQFYLKNSRWPPRPPRLHVQLTDPAVKRNIVLFAELLLADGDLAEPLLIQPMQDRLARVVADARLSKVAPRVSIATRHDGDLEPEIRAQFARQMAKGGWSEFERNPALLQDAVPVSVGIEQWMLLRDGRSVFWKRYPMGRKPEPGEWWCAATPSKWQREPTEPPEGQELSRGDDAVCVARVHSALGEMVSPAH